MSRTTVFSRFLWTGVLVAAVILLVTSMWGQPAAGPNRGIAQQDFGGKTLSINFGRPSLMGRDLNAAAKPGQVWRLGMNEATVLRTPFDLYTCCGVVKAGAYSLWAKKIDDKNWEMVFNSQTGQWGTEHDPTKDVISVPMKVDTSKESIEKFTIKIVKTAKGGEIRCAWGTQVLVMEFSDKA